MKIVYAVMKGMKTTGKTMELSCSYCLVNIYIYAYQDNERCSLGKTIQNCLAEIEYSRQTDVSVRQLDCLTDTQSG